MNRKGLGFNLGGKGLPGVSPASLPLRCSGLAELRVEGNAEAQSGGVCWAGVRGLPIRVLPPRCGLSCLAPAPLPGPALGTA